MKKIIIILLLLLGVLAPWLAQCQYTPENDTICISRNRLARIADSLTHYRIVAHGAILCDSLVIQKDRLLNNYQTEIATLNNSLRKAGEGAMILESMRRDWEQTATDYKTAHDKILPQLQKAKRAKKTWCGIAIGALAGLGGLVTTLILIK